MSSNVRHVCTMYHFQGDEFRRFISHVLRMHRNSPDFLVSCCYGACAYSTKAEMPLKCMYIGIIVKSIKSWMVMSS